MKLDGWKWEFKWASNMAEDFNLSAFNKFGNGNF